MRTSLNGLPRATRPACLAPAPLQLDAAKRLTYGGPRATRAACLASARLLLGRRPARRCSSYAAALLNPTTRGAQNAIEASYYRGGTSRGLIIQPKDLPCHFIKWPDIFRQLIGSPDPYGRQLDGMGAGVSSLSKICLVEPSPPRFHKTMREMTKDDAINSIDYTFVGMGIETDEVDIAGNCGNMLSAIGPYAYNAGLLGRECYGEDKQISVMIRNTNTGKVITSTFEVAGGQAAVLGDYTIDGVAGTGSKIRLDFHHPFGSRTRKLLPTGNVVDRIYKYDATCVDGANPAVFVRAEDVNIKGTILPDALNELTQKLQKLEIIRRKAGVAMGLAKTEDGVPRTVPKIAIVSRPGKSSHRVLSGAQIQPSDVDLVVRFISDGQPHRAIPLTLALTTAVAAKIPGSIVEQALAPNPVSDREVTIGHASGKIQVAATMDYSDDSGLPRPESATVYRTAKRIMDGRIYYTGQDDSSDRSNSMGMGFLHALRQQQQQHKLLERQSINSKEQVNDQKTPEPRPARRSESVPKLDNVHDPQDKASAGAERPSFDAEEQIRDHKTSEPVIIPSALLPEQTVFPESSPSPLSDTISPSSEGSPEGNANEGFDPAWDRIQRRIDKLTWKLHQHEQDRSLQQLSLLKEQIKVAKESIEKPRNTITPAVEKDFDAAAEVDWSDPMLSFMSDGSELEDVVPEAAGGTAS